MVTFEEWVAARGDALFRLAWVLTGDRAAAEDVVQDALSRALPQWSAVVRTDEPETYVRELLLTAPIGAWGRWRRGGSWAAEPGPPEGPSEDLEPEDAEQERIWWACLALPPEERVPVVLRHHEQREVVEIADLTGVRPDTVRARLAAGLATLRRELDEDDLDASLTEALHGVAARAPRPGDLAAGARGRRHRRRRTTAAVAVLAAAAVAVPVVATALTGDAGRPAGREPLGGEVRPGWTTETWRDLSVHVPERWTGDPSCPGATTSQDDPVVTRPVVACTPDSGYGVHFLRPSGELPPGTEGVVQRYRGERYPDGAWIGFVRTEHAAAWVVAEDRTSTRLVLDSASAVGEVDANGCATRAEMVAPSSRAEMSVCRYTGDGWLQQSEQLSRTDSRLAREVMDGEPAAGPSRDAPCGQPEVVLSMAGLVAEVSLAYRWTRVGEECRALTPDERYWATSPGTIGAVRDG